MSHYRLLSVSVCLRKTSRSIITAFSAFILLAGTNAYSQAELQKVIPLSPNAAAMARYGEIPVGHFTGVPNISIPIYTIQSKELALPISLSYHAGGNKVEDIASWVGLGWSLGTIPSISRNIRGLPDEGTGGFFYKYQGKTVQENYEDTNNAISFHNAIQQGTVDVEADIFNYSLAGKGGKFHYNQQLQDFQTVPKSNIQISFSAADNSFKIVDDDGTVYFFPIKETTITSGSAPGEESITTWYADKIRNLNKTDSLTFLYNTTVHYITNLTPVTKYVGCTAPAGSITTATEIHARNVTKIVFSNGFAEFNGKQAEREDLSGGHALESIKVFNHAQRLVKWVDLIYSYSVSHNDGISCAASGSQEKKRLMLSEVVERNNLNPQQLRHRFKYDSTIMPPCRLSAAQDYWGYYNGKNNNPNLVPTVSRFTSSGLQQVPGADRNVDPGYSMFGVLKRIYFPTGGYTDFQYENNTVSNDAGNIPRKYIEKSASLSGEPEPQTNVYSDVFTINNPPDLHLNNNNPNGGAVLNIMSGDVGCNRGDPCAVLTLRGISPSNLNIYYTINFDFTQYVPNGEYEIKAQFNQNPIQYQNFYFQVVWQEIDSTDLGIVNRPVGGLRVKEIKTYDAFGASSLRKYKYTTSLLSDTTSGDVFGPAYFNFTDDIMYVTMYIINSFTYYQKDPCLRIKSYPNISSVSHSGSFVGYQTVFESYGDQGTGGIIRYRFSHVKDQVQNNMQHTPLLSHEFLRGQLKEQTVYAKDPGGFKPVKRTRYSYLDAIDAEPAAYSLKAVRFLEGEVNPAESPLAVIPYQILCGWSGQRQQYETTYDLEDVADSLQQFTEFEYHPSRYQVTKTRVTNSLGQQVSTSSFYPEDITFAGDAEIARLHLVAKNNISTVVKTERFEGTTPLEAFTTLYKKGTGGIAKPAEIISKTKNANTESRVKFVKYDMHGNLLEQQKTNDAVMAYVWDYNQNLAVAEVVNAEQNRIAYTSFETDSTGGWKKNAGGTTNNNATITGLKSYSGGLYKNNLPTGNYIVTLWASGDVTVNGSPASIALRTKNGWSHYEWKLTNPGSVQIQANNMDEVRLYPENAQMTTYCYEPLVGMSAQCDVRNDITYYEYDGFGRLLCIRDINNNILKQLDYEYQAPAR